MNKINKIFLSIVLIVFSCFATYAYTAKNDLGGIFNQGDVIGQGWYNAVNKLIGDGTYSPGMNCSYSSLNEGISCTDSFDIIWEVVDNTNVEEFDINCEWRVEVAGEMYYPSRVTNSSIVGYRVEDSGSSWKVDATSKSKLKTFADAELGDVDSIQKKCLGVN